MACEHLTESGEAYAIGADGAETRITHHLCTWADEHPERFLDAPRWLSEWALSGGPNFHPARHCHKCPGYTERDR